jgi:hypothetical protein
MSACPSRFELSRWEAHPEPDRPSEFTLHVGGCDRCALILADISEARALLLGPDPAATSVRAARAIVETVRLRKGGVRRWLGYLAPVLLVPAVAALLFLARPSLPSHSAGVKGGLIVETYRKRGGDVSPATDGGDYFSGDQLRFAYTQDRPGFLLVFGVDDTGEVFPYYEEGRLVGTPVQAGARILLPGSVELDGHKGWERIFLLWSETLLSDDAVRSAVATSLAATNRVVRRTSTLDLPVEQVSFLLRRP